MLLGEPGPLTLGVQATIVLLLHSYRLARRRWMMPRPIMSPVEVLICSGEAKSERQERDIRLGIVCADCNQRRTGGGSPCGPYCVVGKCFFGSSCPGCLVCTHRRELPT
jgi:hypothetical protein